MAPDDQISAINNPLGLGTLGLGAGGAYSSYYPYMTGMYGGYGMDNIFNMYQSMQNMRQNMEIANANHTNIMNGIMNKNEVSAVGNAQSALVSKIMQNGSVMTLLGNLIDKVHKGELDGVCKQYNDLKNQIYSTYRDELLERGNKENPERTVREIIDILYSQKMSGASLRDDIAKFGDSAFKNGMLQEMKPGHDKKYVEEALYEIYHEDVSNQEYNEHARGIGMMAGGTINGAKKAIEAGAVVGGAGTLAGGTIKLFDSIFKINKFSFGKWTKGSLKAGAMVAAGVGLFEFGKGIFNGTRTMVTSEAS